MNSSATPVARQTPVSSTSLSVLEACADRPAAGNPRAATHRPLTCLIEALIHESDIDQSGWTIHLKGLHPELAGKVSTKVPHDVGEIEIRSLLEGSFFVFELRLEQVCRCIPERLPADRADEAGCPEFARVYAERVCGEGTWPFRRSGSVPAPVSTSASSDAGQHHRWRSFAADLARTLTAAACSLPRPAGWPQSIASMKWANVALAALIAVPGSPSLGSEAQSPAAKVRPASNGNPGESYLALGIFGIVVGSLVAAWGASEIATEIGQGIGNAAACVLGCDRPRSVDEASPVAVPALIAGVALGAAGMGSVVYGLFEIGSGPEGASLAVRPAPAGASLNLRF